MSYAPASINPVSAQASAIPVTGGADAGVGFHSNQPISISRYDPTEQTQFKNKLEEEQQDINPEPVQTYQKFPESPFTRYVRRPLSDGVLSNSVVNFKLEDRSSMGVPLNPFWIRNDLWSMQNEADIFMDVDTNFVAPTVTAAPGNVPAGKYERTTYLDNEEQPQHGTGPSNLQKSTSAPPMVTAAGTVTSAVVASDKTQMEIPQSNPAIPGQQGTEGKEGELKSTSPEDKNGGGAVGAGDANIDLAGMEEIKPPKKKKAKKVST